MAGRRKLDDRSSRRDAAFAQARDRGFAARAVFKLEEIDQKFRLLGPNKRVLDLGCWPGSWMQYAAERVGDEGLVVGLDLKQVELALPAWTHPIVADVETLDPARVLERFGEFDVVLSDMAPHTSGDRNSDQYRSEELTRRALLFARSVLRPGGHFVAKVFQGGEFKKLMQEVGAAFGESKAFHAKATRIRSTEQYLIGRGLKAGARLRGETESSG